MDFDREWVQSRAGALAKNNSTRPVSDTVVVTQGKTELKGQTLVSDETDGIVRIKDRVCLGPGVLAVMFLNLGSFDCWCWSVGVGEGE